MPLFNLRIAVLEYLDIPISAETKEKALTYINSTDEWKSVISRGEISLVSVDEVSKKDNIFPEDILCWHSDEDEITVAEALRSRCKSRS